MASLETIKRLILRAQAEGFEDVAGKLQTLIRAEDGVVASSERMEKSTGRTAQSWGKFVASVDPAAKMLQQVERSARLADTAVAQGIVKREAANEVLAEFERKQIASVRALTPALQERAKQQEAIAAAQAKQADASEAAAAKQAAAVKSVSTSIQGQIAQVRLSATEYEKYQAIQKAGVTPDSTSGRLIAVQVAELQGQRSVVAKAAAEKEAFLARAKTGVTELTKAEKEATEQQAAYARQTHEIRSQVEPVAVAEEKRNRVLAEYKALASTVNPITGKMYLSQEELAKATAHANNEFERAARNGGLDKFANGMKLASNQSANLAYQLNDVISGIAMGQSPFTILAQQGGQVYQVMADIGGGQGLGALKRGVTAVGAALVNVFTPARVAIGGATAALVTLGVAANHTLNQELAARQATTGGLGGFSSVTAGDVGQIARRTEGNGVSINQAREGVLAFAQAGVASNEVVERGAGLAKRYAASIGGELVDAYKDLAKFSAEPGKNIDSLAEKFHIDAPTVEYIKRLDAVNDKTAAAKAGFDALEKSLVKGADATNFWGRQWAAYKSDFERGFDFLGEVGLGRMAPPSRRQETQQAIASGANLSAGLTGNTIRSRGALPEAAIDEMQATATAEALDREARRLKAVTFERKAVGEAIRKNTEAHDLEVTGIQARTAAEQAGVVTTQTYLAVLEKTGKDEVARSAATQAGDKVMTAYNRQQEDATRIGAANVQMIKAFGLEQVKAAAAAQALAVNTDNYAGAQARVDEITTKSTVALRDSAMQHKANVQLIRAETQGQIEAAAGNQAYTATLIQTQGDMKQAVQARGQAVVETQQKDIAAARQIERISTANVQAIKAETQAQLENAVAAQAAAQHPVGSAAGEAAASAARREAQEKDIAGAREIGRAHAANMQAIVALTTEEKANAAASVAAAGQVKDSIAGKTAAVAAYSEEVTKAAVVQRDFDRNLQASRTNAIRSGQAELQAAQLPIGPGRQRVAGQIEAEAQGRNQAAAIQAQNPNIQIDTSAFVKAAQDVAALGEAARQSNVSLQLIAGWETQAANLNVATAALTGGMDKAAAAAQQVINSGMAQINALGLEGDERQRAIQALGGLAQAAAANAEAQDLSRRNQEALAKSAAMAAAGITSMGVALKNIVHNATISAQDAAGKTLGAGVTLTGLLTGEGYRRATAAAAAKEQAGRLEDIIAVHSAAAANDNIRKSAMSISSPVSGLIDDAQSRIESAQDSVKSAQEAVKNAQAQAQPMENASKSDPRLDPYLSRNASVYYGTATEQFYKEISWQDASLSVANESLSTEQEALAAAQQELAMAEAQHAQLQNIADSANKMAAMNMSPDALGEAVARALGNAGFAKTGLEVSQAAQDYQNSLTESNLQSRLASLNKMASTGLPASSPMVTGGFAQTQPFTSVQNVALLKPHATGADVILPGSGNSEQPYMVSGQPGERLEITPKGADRKGGVVNNDNRVTQVFGVTDPNVLLGKLAQLSQQAPAGYSGAATRALRLRAA